MRVVFFDIEASDLKANWGRLHCCSFLEWDEKGFKRPYTFRIDDRRYKGKTKIDDSKLAIAIKNELEKFNVIVGWNSKGYDIPFVNARLAACKQRPILTQFNLDLMWFSGGSSMRLGSKRLDNVAKFFHLPFQKTPLDTEEWKAAMTGERKAMDRIVEHCEADVKVLREAYIYLLPSVKNLHR